MCSCWQDAKKGRKRREGRKELRLPRKVSVVERAPAPEQLPSGLYLHKYGVELRAQFPPLELELLCAKRNRGPDLGGLGAYRHLRNAINLAWPKTIWNSFLERQVESFAESEWNGWVGAGGTGKTHAAILCAMPWWLMDPRNSSVVITSTTGKMIRKRAWPVVRRLFHDAAAPFYGHMVDSKTMLQAEKGDDKHGIFAQAVAEGSVAKAVAGIQGVHSKRMLIIIDEAEETPEAIFDAIANLIIGTSEFRVLLLYNPASKLSKVGQMSEPRDGWQSITIDDESWETRDQLNGKPMVINRFDSEKSPNILAGQTLFPFLVTQQQYEAAKKQLGDASPLFWKFWRGWWAPEGMVKTVFSESMLVKMDGFGQHLFLKILFRVAGFDPAFGGGDRPMLQFAECGLLENGNVGIQLTEGVKLSINSASSNPIHFQLAEQLRRECESREVPPENVAVDETGEGGGLCDIISRTWSPNIIKTSFGGKASESPVSKDDVRLCRDVYDNKVGELWHQARLYMLGGLLKGLSKEAAKQFCNRLFDDMSKRDKIILQSKREMKIAYGRSPDEADAVVLAVEAARNRGASVAGGASSSGTKSGWLAKAREFDRINDTNSEYDTAKRTGFYGDFQITSNF